MSCGKAARMERVRKVAGQERATSPKEHTTATTGTVLVLAMAKTLSCLSAQPSIDCL